MDLPYSVLQTYLVEPEHVKADQAVAQIKP